mgnify:CR=1 FL=1
MSDAAKIAELRAALDRAIVLASDLSPEHYWLLVKALHELRNALGDGHD